MLVWAGEARTISVAPSQPLQQAIRQEDQSAQVAPPATPRAQTLSAASSPSCSVTWSTPPSSRGNSTRKTCVRWCGPIKRPVLRSYPIRLLSWYPGEKTLFARSLTDA